MGWSISPRLALGTLLERAQQRASLVSGAAQDHPWTEPRSTFCQRTREIGPEDGFLNSPRSLQAGLPIPVRALGGPERMCNRGGSRRQNRGVSGQAALESIRRGSMTWTGSMAQSPTPHASTCDVQGIGLGHEPVQVVWR